VTDIGKHSSLLRYGKKYCRKKFYSTGLHLFCLQYSFSLTDALLPTLFLMQTLTMTFVCVQTFWSAPCFQNLFLFMFHVFG